MARSHLRQTHSLRGIEPLDCGDNQPQARMYFGNRSLRVIVIGQPYSGIDSREKRVKISQAAVGEYAKHAMVV